MREQAVLTVCETATPQLIRLLYLSAVITRSSSDRDPRLVHLHSDASETSIEVLVGRAVRDAVDGAQLRGDLLKDPLQILDPIRMIEPPTRGIGKRTHLVLGNFSQSGRHQLSRV